MKGVSFSLSSSKNSSKKTNLKPTQEFKTDDKTSSQPDKEFLTIFDPSKSQISQSNTLVIPPKPNEWRPHKKMRNLDLPIQSSEDRNETLRFEVDPSSENPSSEPDVTYGLNLRQSSNHNSESVEPQSYESIDRLIVKKLREDLDKLPEDRGFEEFDDVPVEGFGAALLKGYGWYEGRGIGRNHKEDVKIVEFDRRAGKEGLGFVAAPLSNVDIADAKDGHKKKEKDISGYFVGKDVRILEVMGGGDYVVLKVFDSGKEMKVRGRDVADLGSVEEERCLKKLKELKIGNRKKNSRMSRGERREEKHVRKDRMSWLVSNIRVRIISKEFKGGRLYLKKGKVVDVVGPTTCDISMDGSRELIQGVEQELLETAIPRSGGPVLVLYGKYKGVYGSLLEKNMEKETAVVQDADTQKPLHVLLEQIAEYTGDPSDIGY